MRAHLLPKLVGIWLILGASAVALCCEWQRTFPGELGSFLDG
jgi:hypothetical protein